VDAPRVIFDIALLSFAILIPFGIVLGRRKHAKFVRAWERAAETLCGRYAVIGPSKIRMIHAEVDGVGLTIDYYTTTTTRPNGQGGTDTDTDYHTRVRVPVDEPGFTLQFGNQGLLAKIGKALGAQDIEIGDPEFDDAVVVKSNRPRYARAWLAGLARAPVKHLASSFRVHEQMAFGELDELVCETDQLVRLARLTATFARGGAELRERWRAAAQTLGANAAADGLACELVTASGIVRLALDLMADSTVVSIETARGGRAQEVLELVEPDANAWRDAIERVVAQAGGAAALPYR
jgi:hypothetical protein